jgi:hypothetical protein
LIIPIILKKFNYVLIRQHEKVTGKLKLLILTKIWRKLQKASQLRVTRVYHTVYDKYINNKLTFGEFGATAVRGPYYFFLFFKLLRAVNRRSRFKRDVNNFGFPLVPWNVVNFLKISRDRRRHICLRKSSHIYPWYVGLLLLFSCINYSSL